MASLNPAGKQNGIAAYDFSHRTNRRKIDIRLLPSLVPGAVANSTAHAIEPELSARISKLKTFIDAGSIDQEITNDGTTLPALTRFILTKVYLEENPQTTCPFTFYGQIEPSEVPEVLMLDLEEELQKPTGIWTVPIPKLSIGGVLLSQECGLLFDMKESEGLR